MLAEQAVINRTIRSSQQKSTMTHMLIHDPLLLLAQAYGGLPHISIYLEVIFETFSNGMAQLVTVFIK